MKIFYATLLFLSFSSKGQVSPFLTTTWNQTCYYNALMPTVGAGGACGKAFTGCNATALAQICKYYVFPNSGNGNHCNSNSPTDCVDYSLANYDYSLMPNNVTGANAQVATLMYDLGVGVDMNWNGTNSTSFFSSSILKTHYWYSPKMYSTAIFLFPTIADLIAGIKEELDNGRPVFAKGGGHFYLIDGYNISDEFHMNFGWGGTYDGYYAIDNVVNGAGTFNPSNFIFNIQPMVGDLETANDTIFISAASVSNETVEFSSTLSWTMNTNDTWITPSLSVGAPGYFNFSNGSTFASEVNNGAQRIGYISVQNANETDTIVVVQAASPMTVNPNPIYFNAIGGSESVSVTHDSWVTWNVVASDVWLSSVPSTGTGNGIFDIVATDNSGGLPRMGYVIVTGGIYTDSIAVFQDTDLGISTNEDSDWKLSPNPTNGIIIIRGISKNISLNIINTLGGKIVAPVQWNGENLVVDFTGQKKGVYFIEAAGRTKRVVKL